MSIFFTRRWALYTEALEMLVKEQRASVCSRFVFRQAVTFQWLSHGKRSLISRVPAEVMELKTIPCILLRAWEEIVQRKRKSVCLRALSQNTAHMNMATHVVDFAKSRQRPKSKVVLV